MTGDVFLHSAAAMGTVVTIQIVGHGEDAARQAARAAAVARAMTWFATVERCCSRFDEASEVRRLAAAAPGAWTPVSDLVFELVSFALAVAAESGGAFDPTVGVVMEQHGFDREYRSGAAVPSGVTADGPVSFRDVRIDPEARVVSCARPLLLDFGGVAKGMAIDLAARELAPLMHFAIEAGGDLYLSGHNADDAPWSVGIRDPRRPQEILETLHVSNAAVCTSGDYERRTAAGDGHHLLNPRTGRAADRLASATVVAPAAVAADALATAAFVLGPDDGLALLERSGVEGLLVTPALDRIATAGFHRATVLPNT